MMTRSAATARILRSVGCVCLLIVVLTHVAERWQIFPGMGWGMPNRPGHYLDLLSALLGVALLIVAYLKSPRR